MVIRFLCPQGHKVHCPDEQAGRAAKCPQCGERFRVPPVGVSEDARAERTEPSTAPGSIASSPGNPAGSSAKLPLAKGGSSVGKPKEPQIEFLCPNGHRLNGPASLQGRPGQCPECGSKFRIPTYDDISQEEELEQDINSGAITDEQLETSPEEPLPDEQEDYSAAFADTVDADQPLDSEIVDATPLANPQAQQAWEPFLAAIWPHKSSGVVVEIVLQDGEKILADRYAPALSRDSCGVFAAKGSNGVYTITALPWSSVSQIVVQGLKHLPADLFE